MSPACPLASSPIALEGMDLVFVSSSIFLPLLIYPLLDIPLLYIRKGFWGWFSKWQIKSRPSGNTLPTPAFEHHHHDQTKKIVIERNRQLLLVFGIGQRVGKRFEIRVQAAHAGFAPAGKGIHDRDQALRAFG